MAPGAGGCQTLINIRNAQFTVDAAEQQAQGEGAPSEAQRSFRRSYFRFAITLVCVFIAGPLVFVALFFTVIMPMMLISPSMISMIYLLPVVLVAYIGIAMFWFFKRSRHIHEYKSAIIQKAMADQAPMMDEFKRQIRDDVIREMREAEERKRRQAGESGGGQN